jgi:hypothetical protein
MHGLRVASLILAGIAGTAPVTPAAAATAAERARMVIIVRVYQTGLSAAVERRALAEAGRVLRAALVDVQWEVCSRATESAVCQRPRPSELLLRMVREGPRHPHPARLGDAIVDPCSRCGVLATVYLDRVTAIAGVAQADLAILIGRVAAHELGHLMTQTSAHSRSGLMRGNWTPAEIRRNGAADWTFSAGDVEAMASERSADAVTASEAPSGVCRRCPPTAHQSTYCVLPHRRGTSAPRPDGRAHRAPPAL